jgi:hypothetical protein
MHQPPVQQRTCAPASELLSWKELAGYEGNETCQLIRKIIRENRQIVAVLGFIRFRLEQNHQ